MRKYKISKKALSDLKRIWEYSSDEWNEPKATDYYLYLVSTFEIIAQSPSIGRDYNKTAKIKKLNIGQHITFYKNKDPVVILRVLHQSMDVKTRV